MSAIGIDRVTHANSENKPPSGWERFKASLNPVLKKAFKLVLFLLVCVGVAYLAYQPDDLIDKEWSHFQVFQRGLFWFLRGTAVRSLLGALGVLLICSFAYWVRIRKQRFIVVSDFRVWGVLSNKFPKEGVVALLRDELMKLSQGTRSLPATTPGGVTPSPEQDSIEKAHVLFIAGGLSLPETHITLQYEGISLEAFLTFVRRTTKREVVISGDLLETNNGIVLFARGTDDGPWQVIVEGSDSEAFRSGLQRLSLRIMATLAERFQPKAARAFGLLQNEARELGEYDLAFRLAKRAYRAAPESLQAKSNLAIAHSDLGVELTNKEMYAKAIREFEEATTLNPEFAEAHDYLEKVRKEHEAGLEESKASQGHTEDMT
jgi:hypothetical protein